MQRLALAFLPLALVTVSAGAGELSDAMVEKTLGLRGVNHTLSTKTRYGMTYSDAHYQAGGKELFVLRTGTPEQYAMWKQAMGAQSTPVSSVGSEAFRVKDFRAVCAKTATAAVCVTPSVLPGSPQLSDAQVDALTRSAL